MRDAVEIVLAQATTVPPGSAGTAATSSTQVATVGADWWLLMSLIYLGCGVIAMAATLIAGCQWHDCGPARRAWAARHQVHGISFSTLLLLAGLFLGGFAQFVPPAEFGPTMVFLLLGLMVFGIIYLLSADYFDTDFEDDVPRARPAGRTAHIAPRESYAPAQPQPAAAASGHHHTAAGTAVRTGETQPAAAAHAAAEGPSGR